LFFVVSHKLLSLALPICFFLASFRYEKYEVRGEKNQNFKWEKDLTGQINFAWDNRHKNDKDRTEYAVYRGFGYKGFAYKVKKNKVVWDFI
jgi:hypothetical protein